MLSKSMENIKVSVIMPVYNSGKFLDAAVKSILSQDFKSFELILVDDGSTDGSSLKCDEIAKVDSRVVVLHKANGGICSARNAALDIVRGEYIAFSDHDDEYRSGALSCCYAYACKHQLDVVKFGHRVVKSVGESIVGSKDIRFGTNVFKNDLAANFLMLTKKMVLNDVWDGLYRTSFVKNSGVTFDTSYKHGGEDLDFNRQLFVHKPQIGTIDDIYYDHYVRLGVSTSTGYKEAAAGKIVKWPLKFSEYLTSLRIQNIERSSDYIQIVMQEAVGSLIQMLSRRKCSHSFDNKKKMILEQKDYIIKTGNVFINSSFKVMKMSLKYGFLFFLVKHNLFRLALCLYKLKKV